jgi:two-component system NtrC family sensor kinase
MDLQIRYPPGQAIHPMIRRLTTLFRSLEIRLLVPLSLTIGAVLAVFAVLSFRSTHDHFMQLVYSEAERSSGLIRMATHDGMLLNKLDEVQATIERLAEQPELAAIRVYDKEGAIVLSADPRENGQMIDLASDTCRSCHGEEHVTDDAVMERSSLARAPQGAEVLRHLTVIENEPACAVGACHPAPAEQRILGVLDVEMSMAPLDAVVATTQRQLVLTTLALIIISGLIVAVFVRRVVHRPTKELFKGTQRIAAGDLDSRISVQGEHELALLGDAFNRMADELRTARNEVTEWSHSLEDKVKEKSDELERAQRQVMQMEKMASLGKLAATVAHELNNPISGMLTYVRLVERELGDQEMDPATRDELKRYLGLVAKECSRCGSIVHNLLTFSRRKGGKMETVDLNELVDRCIMLIRHHLEMKDISVEHDPLAGDSKFVADANQIQQALLALFVNAAEAMQDKEGERTLRVRLRGDEQCVQIRVSDTGSGIPWDALSHIFEPFYSTKTEESGVGLGLAVVYGIINRHGGHIDVDSEPGRGTTFYIHLPRVPQPEAAEDANAPADAPAAAAPTDA